jgi:hypothetical protein
MPKSTVYFILGQNSEGYDFSSYNNLFLLTAKRKIISTLPFSKDNVKKLILSYPYYRAKKD